MAVQEKQQLEKVATRFYHPITIQAWYDGATRELERLIGVGFEDVIFRFDGRKIEAYRIADDLHARVKPVMLEYVLSDEYAKQFDAYTSELDVYFRRFDEQPSLDEMAVRLARVYTLMVMGYFVPVMWIRDVPHDDRSRITALSRQYRKRSEGIFNVLDAYVVKYLFDRGQSPFSVFDTVEHGARLISRPELERGYICSEGEFLLVSWQGFLSEKGFEHSEDTFNQSVSTFQGTTAFSGRVRGIVRIVYSSADFEKVCYGDILVTAMTQPTFMSVLSRVGGIITDEGGVTCHAAIVARELGKPCVIGTKIATKVLKDGDMVEVDGDKGIVKKL